MKKYFLVITICISIAMVSCEGNSVKPSDVPPAVVTSFDTKYPGATNAEWKKEKSDGKDVYEAAFKLNGKEIEAEFLPDGTFYKED
ncbi:MAG TPA: hypothetical protein VK498_15690 [Ferruginibacter sp.]|nr:hypothetical protein [Ferruginibacter sp.]